MIWSMSAGVARAHYLAARLDDRPAGRSRPQFHVLVAQDALGADHGQAVQWAA